MPCAPSLKCCLYDAVLLPTVCNAICSLSITLPSFQQLRYNKQHFHQPWQHQAAQLLPNLWTSPKPMSPNKAGWHQRTSTADAQQTTFRTSHGIIIKQHDFSHIRVFKTRGGMHLRARIHARESINKRIMSGFRFFSGIPEINNSAIFSIYELCYWISENATQLIQGSHLFFL